MSGHVFDTGLQQPQRTLIRAAIAAQLADLLKSADVPRYLHAIVQLPKPVRGAGDEDGKAMLNHYLQGAAPAVAIALGRKSFDRLGPNALEVLGELEIVLYVASRHERGLVDGRLSQDVTARIAQNVDPGIDTMLEHIEERLLGQELGIETVSALSGGVEDEVMTFDDVTVWSQTYSVVVDRTVNPARGSKITVTSVENRVGLDEVSGDLDDPDNAFVTTRSSLDPEA